MKLLPPDINRSGVEFTVEGEGAEAAVRYALAAVKGVGAQAMEALVAERQKNGPYRDLFDLAERLDTKQFNKRQFENLAKAGAFDSLMPEPRPELSASARRSCCATPPSRPSSGRQQPDRAVRRRRWRGARQASKLPTVDRLAEPIDRLQQEFEAIGFYLARPTRSIPMRRR